MLARVLQRLVQGLINNCDYAVEKVNMTNKSGPKH